MGTRIYYLSASNPSSEISCEVSMRSHAFNTSTMTLKRSGGTRVKIARTGSQGEELGSGNIKRSAVGATQDVAGAKLIVSHSLDLGFATEEDQMLIFKAATKEEAQEKFDDYVKLVKDEKWEEVFEILNLSIFYKFDGGLHGPQAFEYDYDDVFDYSEDGIVIVLSKAIHLTHP